LLRALRPRFNRAGTRGALPRFLVWRSAGMDLELAVMDEATAPWRTIGLLRGAGRVRDALGRLIWRAAFPDRSFSELPHGWSGPAASGRRQINCEGRTSEVGQMVETLLRGDLLEFAARLYAQADQQSAFDAAALGRDLEMAGQGLANFREARP